MAGSISRHLAAAGIAVSVLAGGAAAPARAQDQSLPTPSPVSPGPGSGPNRPSGNPDRDASRYNINFRNVTPSRLDTLERREFDAVDQERRRRRMGPEELRSDIAIQLGKAGIECEVQAYKRVGMTPNAQSIYETACGAGPGYVLVNGVEPAATSCLVLSGAATNARRRDPNAVTGAQCTLPENQNGQQLIGAWAREAGVTCRVDQGEWLGASDAGFDIYEVGCAGSEGYWMEKASSGWTLRGCLQVNAEGLNCRFTDAAEQRAWMRGRLAGTPAAQACDVAEIRVIGTSSQGTHYETRCSTPGQGFILRVGRDQQAYDVQSCLEVARRSTACTLTDIRPARSDS